MLAQLASDDTSPAPASAPTTVLAELPDVTVVVPTRNEEANVDSLVAAIQRVMTQARIRFEILFVDDSDDLTPEAIAAHTQREESPVRLLHRRPGTRAGGLAGALCAGFAHAHGRVAVCIDADLQHPPELLAPMSRLLLDGAADVVIGSRYLPGGGAAGLAGPWRRLASVASRDLTRALIPVVRRVTDPGSGLFGIDRRVLDGVELRPLGYKALVEVLARGNWTSICEIPYRFGRRGEGTSSASAREGARFVRHLARLATDRDVRGRPTTSKVGRVFAVRNPAVGDHATTLVMRHDAA
ncbi:MAG: glycosyltransferase [Acidimicrobiia bacterium]